MASQWLLIHTYGVIVYNVLSYTCERTHWHVLQKPSHLSGYGSSGIIDVVYSFQGTLTTSYEVYKLVSNLYNVCKLVSVPSLVLALALPHHVASELSSI